MTKLPSRQVHLDFHTSEYMPEIGKRFSKENFQKALQTGNLNSITVFAKCHHSWCYYPTKVGRMHPNLDFDLLGSMIDAAHEIGVRIPIYITVGWSANDAENNPEWLVKTKTGGISTRNYDVNAKPDDRKPIVSWKFMCVNTTYAEHIKALTEEICSNYDVDGVFFDINCGPLCYCDSCVESMKKMSLNPDSLEDAKKFRIQKWRNFMINNNEIIKKYHKDATIFYNDSANSEEPYWIDLQTHFELEDLPTTWGGYDKMPARAKYFAHTGKEYMGMTGKFHTTWGEFGGFKNPNALKYECAYMMAFGAKCSIGDQLHPSGEMDLETYRIIGHAYNYAKQIEPWCYNIEQTANLGIILGEDIRNDFNELASGNKANEGLATILHDKQIDFDIVSDDFYLDKFDAIILPDCVLLDKDKADKINAFIKKGGNVLLTGKSGLDKEGKNFLIDIGADYIGKANYDCDYVKVGEEISEGLVKSPFLFYEAGNLVSVKDAKVLAIIKEPHFSRTYNKYCSHQNTPYKLEDAEHPAAIRKGNVVYLAHPVCNMYYKYGAQLHRDYFINVLNLIYKNRIADVKMLSSGRISFVKQANENRYVLHLLYATPIQRGCASVIEDLPEIYNIDVKINVKENIEKVYLAAEHKEIPFQQNKGKLTLTVPKVKCHQIVVFDY